MKLRDGTLLQPDQCMVCREFGCHSSRHNKATKAIFAAMETDEASGSDCDNGDIEATSEDKCETAAYVSFLSASRACTYIGVNVTEPKGLIGMLVDTGASLLFTVGEKWLAASRTTTGRSLVLRKI